MRCTNFKIFLIILDLVYYTTIQETTFVRTKKEITIDTPSAYNNIDFLVYSYL